MGPLTPRGIDALAASAEIFQRLRERWSAQLGQHGLAELEHALRRVVPTDAVRLDAPGWLGP